MMIKYRAFIRVAELGSITKAAKDLGYSQPGISHMLDSLEQEIGFPLLLRTKDRIVPTENGKRVLECCYQVVKQEDDLQDVVQSITGLVAGSLHIIGQNSMLQNFVPSVTGKFLRTYSGIDIKIEEKAFGESVPALLNGSADIAFTSRVKERGITFHELFKDPVCLLIPQEHRFASYEKIPLQALNGCDFITPLPGWDDLVQIINDQYSIHPNEKYHVASDAAGIAMVSENLGVYILSKLQTRHLPENVIVKEFEENIHRHMGYIIRSGKQISPALEEYIKIAKEIAEGYLI